MDSLFLLWCRGYCASCVLVTLTGVVASLLCLFDVILAVEGISSFWNFFSLLKTAGGSVFILLFCVFYPFTLVWPHIFKDVAVLKLDS